MDQNTNLNRKSKTVHCQGNGFVCIYGEGADIIQAFGPYYSSPEAFSVKTEGEFKTEKISHTEYVHRFAECEINDFIPQDKSVFYRKVNGRAEFEIEIKNAKVRKTLYDNVFLFETDKGAPVYTYAYTNDGKPLAYRSNIKRFTAFSYEGDADLTVISDAKLRIVCRGCILKFAFSHSVEKLFDLIFEKDDFCVIPARNIKTGRFYDAACGAYDTIVSQQSFNGSVLAGYNYHLSYVRDNYGVLRGLLAMGAYERARMLLQYYISVFEKNGCIHNAQGMVEHTFHIHENDNSEITGYVILMFLEYYDRTGDDETLKNGLPLIEFCLGEQHSVMVEGVLPFNGDETYIAGGLLPRSVINDGSSEATALYHESARRTLALEKILPLSPSLKTAVLCDLEIIKKNYLDNFFVNGTFYCNKPGTDFIQIVRHGVNFCGHGFGLCFLNSNGDYVCWKCLKKDLPPFFGDLYGKRFETEAAVLSPAFTGTELVPETVIKKTAEKVKVQIENRSRTVGCEYAYLLYALGYDENIAAKMLALRDKFGAWSEYYNDGVPSGTLCRPWESAVNIAALIENKGSTDSRR